MSSKHSFKEYGPVKILMLAPRIVEIPPRRADAVRLTNYASSLAGLGHKVFCLIFGCCDSEQMYSGTRYFTVSGGVSWHIDQGQQTSTKDNRGISFLVTATMSFLNMTIKAIRLSWKERIDIVHAHWLEGGLVALSIRLLLRKPIVFDPHDWFVYDWIDSLPNSPHKRVLFFVYKALEYVLPKLLNATIVINEGMARRVQGSSRLLILPNCVNLKKIKAKGGLARKHTQEKVITFIGHIGMHQGVKVILEATPKVLVICPGTVFKFAGCGEYEEEAKALAKSLKIDDNVEFLGELTHDDALRLIQQSDVCLAPFAKTRFTSFLTPQKIVEYMAFGKYIVASRVPMIPSILVDYPFKKLVRPGDANELASGIIAAIEDVGTKTESAISSPFWYDCDFQAERLSIFYETLLSPSERKDGSIKP